MSWDQHQRKSSPSDVTDEQWASLAPLMPAPRSERGGRPRALARREVSNTSVSLNRSGGQWDRRPPDVRPTSRVSDSVAQWRDDGTWTTILAVWRERVRREAGREPTPSAACLASQAVKTTEVGGEERGDAGGKNIKGRKRHVLVDTLGLLLAVLLTRAKVDAGAAAPDVLAPVSPPDFPRVETSFGDNTSNHHALATWVEEKRPGWSIAVKSRPPGSQGFTPVRKRWVVERTKAWNGRSRRHSKDYERKPASAAAMIQISTIDLMLRKLAPSAQREFRYNAAA